MSVRPKPYNRNEEQEREANYFAMCLLMPHTLVDEWMAKYGPLDFTDDEVLKKFSKAFNVPAVAAAVRLRELGYFA
jgi:Zn-dependent peptidase ImmA (M78 family)